MKLIEANRAWNSTLRVVIVRNHGGTWLKMWEGPAVVENGDREFDVIAFTAGVNAWETGGVKLGVVEQARHAANEFAGVKYLSWSQNLTWYERAHEQGFDEVVLLNERGEVAECTSANIFAISGTNVWTPPLSSGCLPGVTRAVLLEEIQVPGLSVVEKKLMPADLESADEVFITSTTRELLPVASVDGLKLTQSSSRVREKLQAAFSEFTRAYVIARTPVRAR